jgi:hypothetical protein
MMTPETADHYCDVLEETRWDDPRGATVVYLARCIHCAWQGEDHLSRYEAANEAVMHGVVEPVRRELAGIKDEPVQRRGTEKIRGELEIDHWRGVVYFHAADRKVIQRYGVVTLLRIYGLGQIAEDKAIEVMAGKRPPASGG